MDRVLIHDIKNMEFRLQMLLSNLEENYDDPDFKRSVRELLASTISRLESIVGRWESHQEAVLVKVSLDVNDVLRAVSGSATGGTGRLRPAAAARLPELALSLGQPPAIWGDPYFLRDALASLLDNALEAAGTGGKVLLRSFASRRKGGRVRAVVDVIDNGCGMSAEFVRERLFRPFETTKEGGVGLGLFTAAQIVKLHRGSLRVHSQPGGGTIVRASFPAARPSE
jgi:signal transduction histidine kinase